MGLRHDHPNFWITLIGDVYLCLGLGVGYTLFDNTSTSFRYCKAILPLWCCGLLYLLIGVGLIVGQWHVLVFRLSLNLGVGLNVFMALCIGAAAVADLWGSSHSTPGAGGHFLYMFPAILFIAQSREPRSNPAAAVR